MRCAGSLSQCGSGWVPEAYGSSEKKIAVVTFESEVQPSMGRRISSRRSSVASIKTESQYDTADDDSTSRRGGDARKIQVQPASAAQVSGQDSVRKSRQTVALNVALEGNLFSAKLFVETAIKYSVKKGIKSEIVNTIKELKALIKHELPEHVFLSLNARLKAFEINYRSTENCGSAFKKELVLQINSILSAEDDDQGCTQNGNQGGDQGDIHSSAQDSNQASTQGGIQTGAQYQHIFYNERLVQCLNNVKYLIGCLPDEFFTVYLHQFENIELDLPSPDDLIVPIELIEKYPLRYRVHSTGAFAGNVVGIIGTSGIAGAPVAKAARAAIQLDQGDFVKSLNMIVGEIVHYHNLTEEQALQNILNVPGYVESILGEAPKFEATVLASYAFASAGMVLVCQVLNTLKVPHKMGAFMAIGSVRGGRAMKKFIRICCRPCSPCFRPYQPVPQFTGGRPSLAATGPVYPTVNNGGASSLQGPVPESNQASSSVSIQVEAECHSVEMQSSSTSAGIMHAKTEGKEAQESIELDVIEEHEHSSDSKDIEEESGKAEIKFLLNAPDSAAAYV
ncbi:hypothetical protein [Kistimonas scapharcae]